MAKTEREHREDIVQIGRLVFQKCWVASNDGNISIRLGADRILATPAGVCKGMMDPDDLIVLDLEGNKISGRSKGTSEIGMHLAAYRLRPDVNAVVHAHPPTATGFAVAGRALNQAVLPEVVVTLGSVPLARYGMPGTPAIVEPMLPLIPKHDAILLANHGAVCFGADAFQAYFRMETVEHYAHVALVAELLGGPKPLPRVEVEKLLDSRTRYGLPPKNGCGPDGPLAAEDAPGGGNQRFYVTQSELMSLVEEAIKQRGAV
jgi:L-fuculose-phosphate aldolase